jgi:hypothetical protein
VEASDTPDAGRHGRAGEPADETSRRRAQEAAADPPGRQQDEPGGAEDAERAAVERAHDADPAAPTRQAG